MLVGTPGGDTCTESGIKTWMDEAGITFAECADLGRGGGLMIGTKKQRYLDRLRSFNCRKPIV